MLTTDFCRWFINMITLNMRFYIGTVRIAVVAQATMVFSFDIVSIWVDENIQICGTYRTIKCGQKKIVNSTFLFSSHTLFEKGIKCWTIWMKIHCWEKLEIIIIKVCASKSVYLYKSPYSLKVYRLLAHTLIRKTSNPPSLIRT